MRASAVRTRESMWHHFLRGKDKRDARGTRKSQTLLWILERNSRRYQIREMIVASADAKILLDVFIAGTP